MELKEWLPLVIQFIIALGTLAGAWPLIKRVKFQNSKDNVDAVKVALEIAGIDASEQLQLKKEVHELREILEKRHYKVSIIFKSGEHPSIEEATIESYEIATL